MDRLGRNICCFCLSDVFVVTTIVLLTLCCHLVLDVRGEDSHLKHQLSLPGSLQSRRVLVSGLPSSSRSLLQFRDNITDAGGTLVSWNTTQNPNVCTWVGVQCDQSGHVSALDLSGMGLSGAIPSSLGSLQFLTSIILSRNSFYGEVPSSLGSLRQLQVLDISHNNLTHFPLQLSNWTALTSLNLSRNALTGFIPADIGNLRKLTNIDLQSNLLISSIPASLGNCSLLRWLDLGSNRLVGTIPANLGRLHKLRALRLGENNLTGPIPSSIYNISTLEDVDLQCNLLSGEISPDIGLLRNLTSLILDRNNFTGSIPRSIGNLSSLGTLRVGGAALLGCRPFGGSDSPFRSEWLTGHIPVEIGKLENLKDLWIYRTKCTGTTPAELGNLPKLNNMYLFYNAYLTPSDIPSTFGNLTNLMTLFLWGNNFQGNILPWIGNLVNLQRLILPYNNFTGKLPPEIGNMTNIGSVSFSVNSLNGPVTPELGKLTRLTKLYLDQNWFSGHLPKSLGNLSLLSSLSLFQNNLSGTIPPAILGGLPCLLKGSTLYTLDLSFNQLSGPIPPEIGQCVALATLNISHNRISGELPISSLESLQSLQNFIVNDNLLEGPVPSFNRTFTNVTVNYAGNKGLCGPLLGKNCSSPLLRPPLANKRCHGLNFGCHRGWIYIIAGVGTLLMAILAYLCLLGWKLLRWRGFAPWKRSGHTLGDKFFDVSLFIQDFTVTVEELWAATGRFSKENILGMGGSSTVYKATLVNQNNKLIAVKCVNLNTMGTKRALRDLHNELKILGSLRHRNLVRLYGVCATSTFKALLMELVSGGNLRLHLHSGEEQRGQLTLESRVHIAIGVADALVYLHEDAHCPIIHRDLKPSNILLDPEGNAKVADFGISKFVNHDQNGEATASSLFGSTGYIPPEYAISSKVSTKGDVYSFGVILLEMLTGKAPTDNRFGKDETLVEWVQKAWPDQIANVLDDSLKSELVAKGPELQLLIHVGLLCTHNSPKARPSIGDIKQLLMEAKSFRTHNQDQKEYPTVQELAKQPTVQELVVQPT